MTAPDGAALRRFDALRHEFPTRWAQVRGLSDPAFVRSDWYERNEALAGHLAPVPPRDFLRHPAILYQMVLADRYVPEELPYVASRLGDLADAREDPVGCPPLVPMPGRDWSTSANTVHHLHHLLRYEEVTKRRVADCDCVVEWGAGYGNLAKLIRRRHRGDPTLVLLDTPVFSCLQ